MGDHRKNAQATVASPASEELVYCLLVDRARLQAENAKLRGALGKALRVLDEVKTENDSIYYPYSVSPQTREGIIGVITESAALAPAADETGGGK